MRYVPLALILTAALMLQAPAAHAMPMTFVGNLSGANEVPVVSPAGTGFTTVVLDPTAQTLQVSAMFSGLTSLTTAPIFIVVSRSARMLGSQPRFLRFLGSR
jgi:hypothetical protein